MYKVPKTEPLKLIEIKEKYLLAITNVCMLAQNKEHKKNWLFLCFHIENHY